MVATNIINTPRYHEFILRQKRMKEKGKFGFFTDKVIIADRIVQAKQIWEN